MKLKRFQVIADIHAGSGVVFVTGFWDPQRDPKTFTYFSRDAGNSWNPVISLSDRSIAPQTFQPEGIDPANFCHLISYDTKFMSYDCGLTAKAQNPLKNALFVSAIVTSPPLFIAFTRAENLVVTKYLSRDSGVTWEVWPSNPCYFPQAIFADPQERSAFYCYAAGVIYRSGGYGSTFEKIMEVREPVAQFITDLYSGAIYIVSGTDASTFQSKIQFTIDRFKTIQDVKTPSNQMYVGMTPLGDGTLLINQNLPPAKFVAKFSPTGELLFFRYLGGTIASTITGLDVAPNGEIFVSAYPIPADLPVSPTIGSKPGAYLLRLSPADGKLLSILRIPGPASTALDPNGSLWLYGPTADGSLNVSKNADGCRISSRRSSGRAALPWDSSRRCRQELFPR